MNKIEPIPWRGVRALEKLVMIVLPLLAAAILVLNFLDEALLRRLTRLLGSGSLLAWLANGNNSFIAVAGILFLLVVFALLVRYRLVRNKRLWFGTGCPNCKERDLVRVKRHTADRFYALIGVPAYRYACRNCIWRGVRIGRREYSLEREIQKEQALLRFQPDGLPYLEEAGHGATAELDSPLGDVDLNVFGDEIGGAAERPNSYDNRETPLAESTVRYTVVEILDNTNRIRRRKPRS